jgi:pyruvate dehydrogenase E2 component (dihydrolipoamide acetyltransferase)
MTAKVHALVIPKYGMVMTEGVLASWHVKEGQEIRVGEEIIDIETEKIVNTYESPDGGILRRQVAREGETLPVGALFAVLAESSVAEADIDAFIEEFRRNFKPPNAKESGPSPEVVNVDGRRVRYLRVGTPEGVPVVLIHGFGGDLHNWLFNQQVLAATHPVYAVDLLGHGGSQKSVGDGSIATLAGSVRDLLGVLGVERAHLIGHSLGGAIALSLSLDQPRLVQSLTLIAPAGFGTQINSGFIDGLIGADRRNAMKAVLQQLFNDPGLVSREMVMNVLQAKRIDGAVESLRKIAEACFPAARQDGQLRERLGQLTMPVQVIWGKEDRIIPSSQAAGLPANIGVTVLEHTGHMAHMESAKEVNELLQQFIGSN